MSQGVHTFMLRLPFDLYKQLQADVPKRGMTGFIVEAVKEKLERQQQLNTSDNGAGNPESKIKGERND